MRILLISANKEPFPEPVFPLGLVYIAHALQRFGAEVKIFDMRHLFSLRSLRKVLSTFHPEVVGISIRNIDNAAYPSVKFYLPYYKTIMKTIRSISNAPIILGGSGFSLFSEEMNHLLRADGGIKGEGEEAFIQFLGSNNEKIISGEHRDLDEIVIPHNIDEIFPFFSSYRTIGVQTARGCRNKCIYCTYPVLEGRRHRRRSSEVVAEEISMLHKKYGKRNFFIVDSIFNSDEGHMAAVLKRIVDMNLPIRLSVYLQPLVSDTSLFTLLRRAGCVAVDFGTDSGSSDILASMKKNFTVDDIHKASRACRNAGIDYCHSLIFGGPGENPETIRDTVRMMDTVSPRAVIAMTGVRIYPGTEIEGIAQKEGCLTHGASLLSPQFYFSELGSSSLLEETLKAVSGRRNWFFPGQKFWSSTFGYRLLYYVYQKGPLWRTFKSRQPGIIK
jgi:radical SAM superfamily enzyme YgiQ (UPF0313 family)